LTYPNDLEAIAAALVTLRPYTLEDVRIVHIKNTLELSTLAVSKGCLPGLHRKDGVEIGGDILSLEFDEDGNLHSPWSDGLDAAV
jgi:hypothetical protein